MRSRSGCLTCRARKLKCDEQKPVCGQCTKARRSCTHGPPVTFRHQQNASLNREGQTELGGDDSLKTFYAYRNTFRDDHHWVPLPPQITFVYVHDPYQDLDGAEADEHHHFLQPQIRSRPASDRGPILPEMKHSPDSPLASSPMQRLEALSAAASVDSYSTPPQQSGHDHHHSRTHPSPRIPTNPTSPAASLDRVSGIPIPVDGMRTPLKTDTTLDFDASPIVGTPSTDTIRAETDLEVAFLLRYYSEGPGFGMDLFDCGMYFSSQVPIKAVSNPILRNAACAYAAKHLHRVRGARAPFGGNCSAPARMERWPHRGEPDWAVYAGQYYQRALSLLLEAVPKTQATSGGRQRDPLTFVPANTPDDLLSATAILCEYEAMDMSDQAWSRHLDGTRSLLEMAELGMRPASEQDRMGLGEDSTQFAGSRKAIFWNFARQDFASAFITESSTRLDVNNRRLWVAAGLNLDASGRLLYGESPISRFGNDAHSREDMIGNCLILILSRLNNFIIVGDDVFAPLMPLDKTRPPAKRNADAAHLALSQQSLLEKWQRIKEELDSWHANLPDTFAPAARTTHPIFAELWYPIPMVASAMQNYHMARILLLINKPHESTARTTVTGRLQSYQAIAAEIRAHAAAVCSIALSRPEAAARIFSIQPLFVAGQCLTSARERHVVLDLLKGIQKDLGWATEWRVNQLLKEWEHQQ